MKKIHFVLFTLVTVVLFSGCVSAWMTNATGKKIYFTQGTPRAEVIEVLGDPDERLLEIAETFRHEFRHTGKEIAYAEIHPYRGKINAVDEGGAQATMNALTLGTGEIVVIPYDSCINRCEKHGKAPDLRIL